MKMEKRKELRKQAGRAGVLLLIFAMLLVMSGCRESKVIQEILYSQRSEDIDYNNKTKVANNDENNKEKDPNLSKKKEPVKMKEKRRKKLATAMRKAGKPIKSRKQMERTREKVKPQKDRQGAEPRKIRTPDR